MELNASRSKATYSSSIDNVKNPVNFSTQNVKVTHSTLEHEAIGEVEFKSFERAP